MILRCSKTCAGGVQKRTRGVARAAAHGGKKCTGAAEDGGMVGPVVVFGVPRSWLEDFEDIVSSF